MTDEFGAVPLPPASIQEPITVWYDPSAKTVTPQQPHANQVAAFEAVPNDDCINGHVIDVNPHFVVYAVKNNLIRVLHRNSTLRTLLRGHTSKVTDISFFQNGDVLGTVGGNLIIWRIFYQAPDVFAEKLLEIPSTVTNMTRIIWHPFNPNQFWFLQEEAYVTQKQVATLCETTRIITVPHPEESHAFCQLHSSEIIMDGAVRISGNDNVTDLCWSGKDTRHVLTTHTDGNICLWDAKKSSPDGNNLGVLLAHCMVTLQEEEAVSRCMFLPHDNVIGASDEGLTSAFLTASRDNSVICLWSAFTEDKAPRKLQVFGMKQPGMYNLDLCFGPATPPSSSDSSDRGVPPVCFLLLSNRSEGKIYIVSIKSMWSTEPPKRVLMGYLDYVVPFMIKFPIYSWSIACVPAEMVVEDEVLLGGLNFDIKFHAYQSKMVQQYTLPHYMCLPPSQAWNINVPGVSMESMATDATRTTALVELLDATAFAEEYELDDQDEQQDMEDDDEYGGAPSADSLPVPDGLGTSAAALNNNPFANWLGAIAAKTMGSGNMPPPTNTPAVSKAPPPVVDTSTANIPPTPHHTPATVRAITTLDVTAVPPVPEPGPSLLNPAELWSAVNANEDKKKKADKASSSKANGEKKTATTSVKTSDMKIAILKRGQDLPPTEEVAKAVPTTVPSDFEEILRRTLSTHLKRQEIMIASEVQKAVKQEIQTSVIPALSKMMTQTMEQAVVKPVRAAVDKNAKERTKVQTDVIINAVSASVEEPLTSAFIESMKSVLVPAYESATRQMFLQVSSSLEKGLAAQQSADSSVVGGLATKLDDMARMMDSLSSEVTQLRSALATSQNLSSTPKEAVVAAEEDEMETKRNEIVALLQKRQYEAAFTQAVSSGHAGMAAFCCKNVPVSDVLGYSPALSQPILLCLMQQLGALLVSSSGDDLQTILEWLQEIALTLDPTDHNIHRHVPTVLQHLVASIDTKMAEGDPALRRPLQMLLQVIRGMQR